MEVYVRKVRELAARVAATKTAMVMLAQSRLDKKRGVEQLKHWNSPPRHQIDSLSSKDVQADRVTFQSKNVFSVVGCAPSMHS